MTASLPTGNETKIEIRSSMATRRAWKRVCADLDPEMTQEEVLQVFIENYRINPRRFGGADESVEDEVVDDAGDHGADGGPDDYF